MIKTLGIGQAAREIKQACLRAKANSISSPFSIREIAPEVAQPDLEAMREALRRSDHRGAIRRARLIKLESLEPPVLREIATSMYTAAESLRDDSEDELLGYRLTVEASDLARRDEEDDRLALTVGRALLNRGNTLATLNRSEDALATFDEIVRRFVGASDSALLMQVSKALLHKALVS